jgi:hypothetical protein
VHLFDEIYTGRIHCVLREGCGGGRSGGGGCGRGGWDRRRTHTRGLERRWNMWARVRVTAFSEWQATTASGDARGTRGEGVDGGR